MRQMQNDARMSHTSLHRTANGFKSFHKDIFIGLILWAFGIIKKKMSGKKKKIITLMSTAVRSYLSVLQPSWCEMLTV